MNCLITSAALYYSTQEIGSVPVEWFEGVSSFLAAKGLPVQIFVAEAEGFDFEKHYELAKDGQKLVRALRDGKVHDLSLYSVPSEYEIVEEECVAEAVLGYNSGDFFLGVNHEVMESAALLLEGALSLAGGLPPIRYGIGYYRPQSKGPSPYALGCGTSGDPFDAEGERLGAWLSERWGQARHLTGMFRGAYPANILSDEHVEALLKSDIAEREATLREVGLGSLKPLKQGLWLWELTEDEIPQAEALLQLSGLIINQ
jgi:hypothetical protein